MSKTDQEIFTLIHESPDPEKVAAYMLSLCLDYLRIHGPSPKRSSSDLQESA